MTKTEMLNRIMLLLATAIAAVNDLFTGDTPEAKARRKAVEDHAAGKKRIGMKTDDVAALLDLCVAAIGGADAAEAVFAAAAIQAEIEAATGDDLNLAKLNKVDLLAWLASKGVKVKGGKRASASAVLAAVVAIKSAVAPAAAETVAPAPVPGGLTKEEAENWDESDDEIEAAFKKKEAEDKAEADRAARMTAADATTTTTATNGAAPSGVVPTGGKLANRHGGSRAKLTIENPQACKLKFRGKEWGGTIHPDASIVLDDGRAFRSPSRAMVEITLAEFGKGTNSSWRSFVFTDDDGNEKPIDALRLDPKGFTVSDGSRRPRTPKGSAASIQTKVDQLGARVRRLAKSLDTAKADLAKAQESHAAAVKAEADGSTTTAAEATAKVDAVLASGPAGQAVVNVLGGAAKVAETLTTETATEDPGLRIRQSVNRRADLTGMKVKALRSIAKDLSISGRSSMKAAALVDAIVSAEAAAPAPAPVA